MVFSDAGDGAPNLRTNRVHAGARTTARSLKLQGELNNMTRAKRGLISMICSVAFAGAVAAQPVAVTGTGDPNVDVPAVQAAVDHGGSVVLIGHFSFDRPPTAPAGATYNRMVTVSKNVAISGSRDDNGDLPTIKGGDWPFLIDAAGTPRVIP